MEWRMQKSKAMGCKDFEGCKRKTDAEEEGGWPRYQSPSPSDPGVRPSISSSVFLAFFFFLPLPTQQYTSATK